MPNTYFKFKQFIIHQDQCAMKVCTDACVLGAWFAAKIPDYSTILDIGSGTGLLMMMLAQKSQSEIHGIEIDLPAFKQLKQNIAQNEWKRRLTVFPGDARNFSFPARYDFIISNPPFFENDLASQSVEEQLAKHSKMLRLEELLEVIDARLEPHGSFGLLLPHSRADSFIRLAKQKGFSLVERLTVRQSPRHAPFRSVLHFYRHRENFAVDEELVIQESEGSYSPEFTELLKDYYLAF